MTGHMLGAAGAFEAMVTILAMRDGFVPPTINLEHPDPECDLDYVPNVGRAVDGAARDDDVVRLRRPQRVPGVRRRTRTGVSTELTT